MMAAWIGRASRRYKSSVLRILMGDRVRNQYEPDSVSAPGGSLREVLANKEMSQAELATRMGRPKKTINEIVKGKAMITPETALQLERVLGTPASFWNNLEQNYREYLAKVEERARLEKDLAWMKQFPVSAMAKYGWLEKQRDKVAQLQELLSFFSIASPTQWQGVFADRQAAYRRSSAFEVDHAAVAAWLRQGEREASRIHPARFSKQRFRNALLEARTLTTAPPSVFLPSLQRICADAGVAVVLLKALPKSRVSGATRWLSSTTALIQLSLRYRKDDHLWFTFFHEAGHILLHGRGEVFLEGNGDRTEELEAEADRFASNFLVPPQDYRRFLSGGLPTKRRIRDFATELGIAPGIVVGRLQHDGEVPFRNCNDLKVSLRWVDE
jgi:HTH-type transcriptional regulator / antitoxin HigA